MFKTMDFIFNFFILGLMCLQHYANVSLTEGWSFFVIGGKLYQIGLNIY